MFDPSPGRHASRFQNRPARVAATVLRGNGFEITQSDLSDFRLSARVFVSRANEAFTAEGALVHPKEQDSVSRLAKSPAEIKAKLKAR